MARKSRLGELKHAQAKMRRAREGKHGMRVTVAKKIGLVATVTRRAASKRHSDGGTSTHEVFLASLCVRGFRPSSRPNSTRTLKCGMGDGKSPTAALRKAAKDFANRLR